MMGVGFREWGLNVVAIDMAYLDDMRRARFLFAQKTGSKPIHREWVNKIWPVNTTELLNDEIPPGSIILKQGMFKNPLHSPYPSVVNVTRRIIRQLEDDCAVSVIP